MRPESHAAICRVYQHIYMMICTPQSDTNNSHNTLGDNARWLEFLASFRPNVVYVQGRMNSAHILSRPPHEPLPALPDFGQSNGDTNIPVSSGSVTGPACWLGTQVGSSTLPPGTDDTLAACTCWGTDSRGLQGLPVPWCINRSE